MDVSRRVGKGAGQDINISAPKGEAPCPRVDVPARERVDTTRIAREDIRAFTPVFAGYA
jgi:hypothetical protein